MKKPEESSPKLIEQVGPPPKAPPGFWGEVTYRFQDGEVVVVEIKQSHKL